MKTIRLFLRYLGFVILMTSCVDEQSDENQLFRIKEKRTYSSVTDYRPIGIESYIYNHKQLLEKVCNGSNAYTIYHYNEINLLDYKLHFQSISPLVGYAVVDSTYYTYVNNKLEREDIFYPNSGMIALNYSYQYEGPLLIKKSLWQDNQFRYQFIYEYQDSLCIKETMFDDLAEESPVYYTIHSYLNENRIKSESFSSPKSKKFQVVNFFYDKYNNLIIEQSLVVDPEISAPLDYVYRFEYEKVPK